MTKLYIVLRLLKQSEDIFHVNEPKEFKVISNIC